MIRYPSLDKLPPDARVNIERFKKTAIALELDGDAEEWSLDHWAWLQDAPWRFIVRNGRHEGREIMLRGNGAYTITALSEAPKIQPMNLAIKLEPQKS